MWPVEPVGPVGLVGTAGPVVGPVVPVGPALGLSPLGPLGLLSLLGPLSPFGPLSPGSLFFFFTRTYMCLDTCQKVWVLPASRKVRGRARFNLLIRFQHQIAAGQPTCSRVMNVSPSPERNLPQGVDPCRHKDGRSTNKASLGSETTQFLAHVNAGNSSSSRTHTVHNSVPLIDQSNRL